MFLGAIVAVVVFLSITKRDVTEVASSRRRTRDGRCARGRAPEDRGHARAPGGDPGARRRRACHVLTLLVPNPAEHAEVTDAERERMHLEGEHALALALPLIDEAAGQTVHGSVSARHDPMDAIEETLGAANLHEIILSTPPHHISSLLHTDLPHRVAHLGIPVTTVTASARPASPAPTHVQPSET